MFKIKNVKIKYPERSFPDIDSDIGEHPITGMGRETVVNYLIDKYGQNNVCYVGNRLVYSAKSAIAALAKVYGVPASDTFKCTKWYNDNFTVRENMLKNDEIKKYFEKNSILIDKVDQIVGTVSGVGIHAGGVLISDKSYPVTKYCAVQRSKEEGRIATLYTKKEVEQLGFIKYDILGLSSASHIHFCKELLGMNPYEDCPESDVDEVFRDIVFNVKNRNIFQFETEIGKRAFEDLIPMNIMELANASGIIRILGSEEGRKLYATYKEAVSQNQQGNTEYWVEKLREECEDDLVFETAKDVLADSYGVLIYQEQVANLIVGISSGNKNFNDGNKLRKILDGFGNKFGSIQDCKTKEEQILWHKNFMEILNEFILPYVDKDGWNSSDESITGFLNCKFKDGNLIMPERGIIKWIISSAAYLFSKLHAVAYTVNTYNMMWLKHFHPKEFWFSALMCDKNDLGKITEYLTAIKAETPDLTIFPPDINKSDDFFVMEESGIRYGLCSMFGIGQTSSAIIRERKENGKYKSISDLLDRVSVNKRAFESLLFSNSLHEFGTIPEIQKEVLTIKPDWHFYEGLLDRKILTSVEKKILGINLSFHHPILDHAHLYNAIDDIQDGFTEKCAVSIISKTQKNTKAGKPYLLYKVQDLNTGKVINLFDWFNTEIDDVYAVVSIELKNDYYSLKTSQKKYDKGGNVNFKKFIKK